MTRSWSIDPSHSQVGFGIRHLMISTVRGRFTNVEGSVVFENDDPAAARIDVTVDLASIDTGVEQRDNHLRSADFFDVEKYPKMTFLSRRVEPAKHGFRVIGDLTLHGITREVVLDVQPEGEGRDPWGNDRSAFSASARIDRRDFGLTWNQLLEAGGLAVSEEVRITIEVELVATAAQAAA